MFGERVDMMHLIESNMNIIDSKFYAFSVRVRGRGSGAVFLKKKQRKNKHVSSSFRIIPK